MGRRMKVLLINPSHRGDILENVQILALPPMNLALLAAVTPEEYELEIRDEGRRALAPDEGLDADLVGITCMTCLAPRAYRIADRLRRHGVPVVLGGIHPTMCTEEALAHADAVVCGEAETIWPAVLDDARRGCLRPTYAATDRPDLRTLPAPRRDLLSDGYFVHTVQTSRGCPLDCSFCSVTRFNGGRYRFRPVDDVIAEIADLPGRRFIFLDDNLVGGKGAGRRRALELFSRLAELNKEWGSQICIDIAHDDRLLAEAARSGAKWLFIGFESIAPETLRAMNKRINLKQPGGFGDAVKRIHDHGLAVIGGFIFGNDADGPQIFERTVELVDRYRLDASQFTIQTPLPGTRIYQQLLAEGRLIGDRFPAAWQHYNGFEVVFRPHQMTVEQLQQGHRWAYEQTASLARSTSRATSTYLRTRNLFGTLGSFCWNYDCYRAIRRAAAASPLRAAPAVLGDHIVGLSARLAARWMR